MQYDDQDLEDNKHVENEKPHQQTDQSNQSNQSGQIPVDKGLVRQDDIDLSVKVVLPSIVVVLSKSKPPGRRNTQSGTSHITVAQLTLQAFSAQGNSLLLSIFYY